MRTYYTFAFKMKVLTALEANEGNIFKTAKQFGISKTTVSDWKQNRERIFEQGLKYAEDRQVPLHQRLNLLINQISDALPGMVEKAHLGDATRALTTLITLSESLEAKKEANDALDENVNERLEKLMKLYEDRPEEFARRLRMVDGID